MAMGWDDALIAAAITASSVVGSSMTNQQSASNAAAGNLASHQIANANRQDAQGQYDTNWARALHMDDRNKVYATNMSNSAYQRAMQDMRSAGLNPILAYQQGGATSTPVSGSAPSATTSSSSTYNHQMPHVENVLGKGAASAMQAASVIQNVKQSTATIDHTNALVGQAQATTRQAESQAALNDTTNALTAAQTMTEAERTRFTAAQEQLARQHAVESGARTTGLDLENERFRNYGPRGGIRDLAAGAEAVGRRGASSIGDSVSRLWEGIQERFRQTPPLSQPRPPNSTGHPQAVPFSHTVRP